MWLKIKDAAGAPPLNLSGGCPNEWRRAGFYDWDAGIRILIRSPGVFLRADQNQHVTAAESGEVGKRSIQPQHRERTFAGTRTRCLEVT
jgi:hypothetical protein